jgi:hypothetical protein
MAEKMPFKTVGEVTEHYLKCYSVLHSLLDTVPDPTFGATNIESGRTRLKDEIGLTTEELSAVIPMPSWATAATQHNSWETFITSPTNFAAVLADANALLVGMPRYKIYNMLALIHPLQWKDPDVKRMPVGKIHEWVYRDMRNNQKQWPNKFGNIQYNKWYRSKIGWIPITLQAITEKLIAAQPEELDRLNLFNIRTLLKFERSFERTLGFKMTTRAKTRLERVEDKLKLYWQLLPEIRRDINKLIGVDQIDESSIRAGALVF